MESTEGILLPKLHRWIVPIAHGSFGQSQVPFPNFRTISRRTMGVHSRCWQRSFLFSQGHPFDLCLSMISAPFSSPVVNSLSSRTLVTSAFLKFVCQQKSHVLYARPPGRSPTVSLRWVAIKDCSLTNCWQISRSIARGS